MILPSKNQITLGFNVKTYPYSEDNPHKGVDFAPIPDAYIYAPEDGVVTLILNDPSMGDSIHLYAENRHHALCHTSQHFVKSGQLVKQGDRIGVMGYTGYVIPPGPAGTHLHWALAIDNVLVDPLKYVTENDMPTEEEVDIQFQAVFNRRATADEVAYWKVRTWDEFVNWSLKNSLPQRTKAANFDQVYNEKVEAETKLAAMEQPAQLKKGFYEVL